MGSTQTMVLIGNYKAVNTPQGVIHMDFTCENSKEKHIKVVLDNPTLCGFASTW